MKRLVLLALVLGIDLAACASISPEMAAMNRCTAVQSGAYCEKNWQRYSE